MKKKTEVGSEVAGISVDKHTHRDLLELTKSSFTVVYQRFFFQQLFSKQPQKNTIEP